MTFSLFTSTFNTKCSSVNSKRVEYTQPTLYILIYKLHWGSLNIAILSLSIEGIKKRNLTTRSAWTLILIYAPRQIAMIFIHTIPWHESMEIWSRALFCIIHPMICSSKLTLHHKLKMFLFMPDTFDNSKYRSINLFWSWTNVTISKKSWQ